MLLAMEKKRVGIFMDDEVHNALKAEAADRGLDMSEMAEAILREALDEVIERQRRKRQAEAKKKAQDR